MVEETKTEVVIATEGQDNVKRIDVLEMQLGESKYIFDPSELTNEQYEGVERLLIDCGYLEYMQQQQDKAMEPKYLYVIAIMTDESEGGIARREIMFKKVKPEEYETPQLAEAEAKARAQFQADLSEWLRVSNDRQLHKHEMLVKGGVRGKIVSHVLVKEGDSYSKAKADKFYETVYPKMKREEVEKALSYFFTSTDLSKSISPKYFTTQVM